MKNYPLGSDQVPPGISAEDWVDTPAPIREFVLSLLESSDNASRPALEIYDSADPTSPALLELLELWRYRALIGMLVLSNFQTRYRRSVLGIVWIFISPLLSTAVLSVAFSTLFSTTVRNYPLYVLVGLLVWQFFLQLTTSGIEGSVSGKSLTTRMYLPRSILIVAGAGTNIVNLFLGLLPLAALMLLLNYPFPVTWLLFPFLVVPLVLFSLGIALLVGTLAVYFGDVAHFYPLLLPILFFLTPIVYPSGIVPEKFQQIITLNPITWFIVMARQLLYDGTLPSLLMIVGAVTVALVTFAVGWWIYTRQAAHFAYYL